MHFIYLKLYIECYTTFPTFYMLELNLLNRIH